MPAYPKITSTPGAPNPTILSSGMTGVWRPSGVSYQSIPPFTNINTLTGAMTAGTLYVGSVEIPAGVQISTLSWFQGNTTPTLGTPPHYWLAIFDSVTRALLGQSTDDTSPPVTTSALRTKSLAAAFTTTYSGQYLIGIMVDWGGSGVQGTYSGISSSAAITGSTSVGGQKFGGSSSTSLGATAPNPAAAITGLSTIPWVGAA